MEFEIPIKGHIFAYITIRTQTYSRFGWQTILGSISENQITEFNFQVSDIQSQVSSLPSK